MMLVQAYDITWKYVVFKDLHDVGLQGRLSLSIAGFLCEVSSES